MLPFIWSIEEILVFQSIQGKSVFFFQLANHAKLRRLSNVFGILLTIHVTACLPPSQEHSPDVFYLIAYHIVVSYAFRIFCISMEWKSPSISLLNIERFLLIFHNYTTSHLHINSITISIEFLHL